MRDLERSVEGALHFELGRERRLELEVEPAISVEKRAGLDVTSGEPLLRRLFAPGSDVETEADRVGRGGPFQDEIVLVLGETPVVGQQPSRVLNGPATLRIRNSSIEFKTGD